MIATVIGFSLIAFVLYLGTKIPTTHSDNAELMYEFKHWEKLYNSTDNKNLKAYYLKQIDKIEEKAKKL